MRLIFAALFPVSALFAQTPAVSIDHEAKHHLVASNEWVRIFDVVVPAHDSTLYHVHPVDYTYVAFGAVGLKAQNQGAAQTDLALADGEVRYTKAPITHRVVNLSSTPFHNLTIELVKPTGASLPPADGNPIVLENDRLRAIRLVLEPGQSSKPRKRGAGLDVAVSPGTVAVTGAAGESRTITYKRAGEYHSYEIPHAETVRNIGKTRIEIVQYDWK